MRSQNSKESTKYDFLLPYNTHSRYNDVRETVWLPRKKYSVKITHRDDIIPNLLHLFILMPSYKFSPTMAFDPRRVERALEQRLMLIQTESDAHSAAIEYLVRGNSGTDYSVRLNAADDQATCTCPDHMNRHSICKHILYVLYRILRVPRSVKTLLLALQQANLVPEVRVPGVCQSDVLRRVWQPHRDEWVEPRWEAGDECAICFDEMTPDHEYVYWCRFQCGKCIHRACATQGSIHNCPLCRTHWTPQ